MRKKLLSISVFLLAAAFANAQTRKTGNPVSWNGKVALPAAVLKMPAVNNATEIQQEIARRNATGDKMLRFGHEESVSINFMTEASVTVLPNGDHLRLLRLRSGGAVSLSLVFSEFELAPGAQLFLSDKNKTQFIGAHTAENNNPARVLGTDLIYSDEMVVELREPAAVSGKSTLVIGNVIHGFLNLEQEAKALNSSGSCEYDVNCPIGAGWENQRNSVAMMVNGGGFCTGSLINNTTGTIIPYFLTADHCGSNPSGWVFRFRWESPAGQADCATSAPSVNGPETMNVNGAVTKSSSANSDFHLVQLNSAPDQAWGIYYNGWDRTENISPGATGIHHPAGDIKKISFEDTPLISTTFGSCPPNSHWGVTSWDQGVTEGGSSGSPLFNTNHRTIGQLHGGLSSCSASVKSDEYGKISVSWEGEGTSAKRLKDWLDPNNTGAEFIDGTDPATPAAANDAGIGPLLGASGSMCAVTTISPTVKIFNSGTATLTSAVVTYYVDNNAPQTYNWTGSLATFAGEVIALPVMTVADGYHTFTAIVSNPNNTADQVNSNDTTTSSFTVIANPQYANLSLTLDCYPDETSWTVTDNNGAVVYSSDAYSNDNATITANFCLRAECYTFTIFDSYGDGMTGGSCPNGFFTLTDADNTVLAELTQPNADFGTSKAYNFCLEGSNLSAAAFEKDAWNLFPNPATTSLNIDLAKLGGTNRITIVNPAGQLMTDLVSQNVNEKIDVAGFAKGVYFVTITSANSTTTKTFVVR